MKNITDQLDFDFSRPIDLQRNIDLDIINECIGSIENLDNSRLFIKHLRLLILELYFCWAESDLQFLSVSMSKRGYNSRSRYNPNNISSYLIKTIIFLKKRNLIELYPGFYDSKSKRSRLTRIKPSYILKKHFKKINFLYNHQINHRKKEILLISKNGCLIEYDDSYETQEKKVVIENYNSIISKTLFDIPNIEDSYLIRGDNRKIAISRFISCSFFVDLDKYPSGTFGGCWWNKLDLSLFFKIKNKLTINNKNTNYLDLTQFFSHFLTLMSSSNVNIESQKNNKYLNHNQICYLIIKGSRSKNQASFYRSVLSEKKKLSLDGLTKKQILDSIHNNIINVNILRSLMFNEKDVGWDSTISRVFYDLVYKINSLKIPIFLVRDKIYFPAEKQDKVLENLEEILSKEFHLSSIKIKCEKASDFDFGKKTFFGKLLQSKNDFSKRYLDNKNYFGIR